MKILVTAKRVIDPNTRAMVKSDGSGIDLGNAKMAINPFDEIAVEQAVRLKEAGIADEVVIVSLGEAKCQEVIRGALAMGADRGIHVQTESELQPLSVASLLKAIVINEQPELVIMGKQAIDDDANQTGQMLAALLGWPQATFASSLEISDGAISVTREIDGGLETLKLSLPALVTTDLRLNEPRYVKLPNIMKAKKKPLDIVSPADLGVEIRSRLTTLKVEEPGKRQSGIMLNDVTQLVEKLKNEAKVLQ